MTDDSAPSTNRSPVEPTGVFARLGSFCVRRRWAIVGVWAGAVILLGLLAPRLGDRLTPGGFEIHGSESHQVPQLTEQHFSREYASGLTAVIELPATTPRPREVMDRFAARVRVVAARYPELVRGVDPIRVAPSGQTGAVLVGLRSSLDQVLRKVDPLLSELDATAEPGTTVRVTGGAAVFRDFNAINAEDLRTSELIQIPLVVIILLLVMGSALSAALPLVASGVAMATTLGGLWFAARVFDLSIYVQNIVPLIGIGVSVDYSLFVITRFREELARGDDVAAAVRRTVATSGRAIFYSGLTVVVALAGMLAVHVPIFTALAVGAGAVVTMAVAAALTLVPALLALLGRRLTPRRGSLLTGHSSARLERWARVVMRHPWRALLAGTAVMLLLAVPVLSMRLGSSGSTAMPDDMPSIQASRAIAAVGGPGIVAPIRVMIDGNGRPPPDAVVQAARTGAAGDRAVVATTPPRSSDDRTRVIFEAVAAFDEDNAATHALVKRLRERILPAAAGTADVSMLVGGAPAQNTDFIDAVGGGLPAVIAIVMGLTFLVLVVLFRSLLLPLKAVILTLLSALASYGVLVAVFQWGWLSGALGFEPLHHVTAWVPPFLFCMLVGLSMDYEVFLLTRIREGLAATGDQREAIAFGVARSGRIITAAAAIMVVVFLSFLTNRLIPIKEAALGMAAAVFIDATIVRIVLVPAVMAIAGRWNWWLPRPLERVLGAGPALSD